MRRIWFIDRATTFSGHVLSLKGGFYQLGIYGQNATSPTKSIIRAAIIYCSYAKLAQSGCTHDTWLDCNIQVRLCEDRRWMLSQDLVDGYELGMPCALILPLDSN